MSSQARLKMGTSQTQIKNITISTHYPNITGEVNFKIS